VVAHKTTVDGSGGFKKMVYVAVGEPGMGLSGLRLSALTNNRGDLEESDSILISAIN
jgi:hypothetical protein